jgi:hypothetical protein
MGSKLKFYQEDVAEVELIFKREVLEVVCYELIENSQARKHEEVKLNYFDFLKGIPGLKRCWSILRFTQVFICCM